MTEIREHHCYRYSVQGGAEIDLVIEAPGKRIGVEFKSGDAPRITESMKTGRDDLNLEAVYLVFPGNTRSTIDERTQTVGIERLPEVCQELRATTGQGI